VTETSNLTVKQLAAYRAAVDARGERAVVLAQLGYSAEEWRRCEERLLGELDDEAERADFTRILAYEQAYKAETKALTGEAAPSGSPAKPGADAAAASQQAGEPSFDTTLAGSPGQLAASVLPFAPGSGGVAAAPARAPRPRVSEDDANLDATAELAGASLAPILPFVGGRGADVDPAQHEATRRRTQAAGGGHALAVTTPAPGAALDDEQRHEKRGSSRPFRSRSVRAT
jgi:hypothetical protein